MNLNQKRKSALYEAISEPIMQRRIEIRMSTDVFDERAREILDDRLFRLEAQIWKGVKAELRIKE